MSKFSGIIKILQVVIREGISATAEVPYWKLYTSRVRLLSLDVTKQLGVLGGKWSKY